ncbi:MAG: PstS family phosphate ABC transporter substrate-binding protein [Bacteroidales bacterium]|nr:PstS family phosphate ABC transporter substrate-binding protein [Bacteroidales bacterium]
MKKVILGIVAIVALVSFTMNLNVKIKGSDTCLPLVQKVSEVYMKSNTGASITVTGGGSGVGIKSLMNGSTDLAMASRKMKMDEKMQMTEAGKTVKEVIMAYDALSVVVHKDNKVSKLTREQVEGIYTGTITNWKEVGGVDMKIVVYSRETSSGTYEFFKEKVLKNKNFAASCMLMPATGAIIQSVSQTKGAIGYVGLAYLEPTVKALNISYDAGKTYVTPSMANAKSKLYPVTRPLYIYLIASQEAQYKHYIDFFLSAEGQKIVELEGYVPIK